jgi:hypothetical protein
VLAFRRIKEMIDLVARQSPEWGQPGAHPHALVTVYEERSHKDMMTIIRNRYEHARHRDDARSAELQCKEGRTL